ncbi:MAG: hypothetical protein HY210_08935 [Candidatus Omnitrophica bacterium]|nr:hypothetical protein [Candidatus Omnitrophota bacterium]
MTSEGPAAFAVYQPPMDLPCSYNAQPCTLSEIAGSLKATVLATSATTTWRKSLNLLPPPLVLVHGVWSDFTAWWDMAQFLQQKGFTVCPGCLVDYGTQSPAGSFDPLDPDTYVIKELIRSTKLALTFMRLNNIAVTQVDVTGHSMGGLVARAVTVFNDAVDQYKAKKNYNKGSIHKIITVGTPHLGTQMADFLVRNKCKKLLGISSLISLEEFFSSEHPIGPAVFGFQTASPALQQLGPTQVPSHTIVGLAPPLSLTEEMLNLIIRAFVSSSENVDNIIDLNSNGHDTIVPRESQEGGVNPLATSRALADVVHADLTAGLLDTGETESQVVWDEVTRLLLALTASLEFDTLPQVTGLGTATFPVNPYIAPAICPASAQAQSAAVSAATVTLLPASGTTFTPGQTVNVQFEVAGGNVVEGALFTVGNKLEGIESPGPFAFSFPAPADHIGDMDITAYTFGPGPENYTSATTITILPAGPFVKISPLTDFLSMDQLGLSLQINTRGYYADGSSVNITKAGTGTLYSVQSGTANVITVSADGLVQAKGPGSDVVLITNRGQSTSVQVEVRISNQPPVLAPIADQTVNEGQLLQFNVSATDPDGNPLVLSARLGSGAALSTIGASFTDNGNGTGTFSWTPDFAQSGFYPVVFQVSDGPLVAEQTVTVTVNDVPVPDLLLTALSTTTTVIAPGNPMSAANTVKNQGTAVAGAFVNAFHLSLDTVYGNADDIVFTTTRPVASLAVGASSAATTGNLTVPVTTPLGDYFLCARADDNATVLEQDENNNTRCTATTVKVAPADLIMTAISGPANGLTGATISVTDTVRNQGQGSITASFIVGYYLSPDAVITTADTRIGLRSVTGLAANASKSGTVNVTIPSTLAPGTYYVGAIADYTNVRLEQDENNNSLAGNTISVTPGADLVISSVSAPATGSTANTISVTSAVMNQGLGAAASSSVGLYISADAVITTADLRLGARSVSSLAVGAASAGTTTVTIPNTLIPGTYYIGAIADYLNARPESNEANNSLAGNQINIVSPDLVMTVISGPASGVRGGTISLSNTVGNQGAGNAASFTIGLYLSTDATITTADRRVGTRSVSTLASGATNAAATTVTIPSTLAVGTYYVGAIADYNNSRAESNEINNALAGNTITVQ